MNRNYKVIWNRSLNCFMAVAEYAKSRGKSSGSVVSSASTASAAVSSGARLLRLSSLTVALAATGMTLSSQVFAATGNLGGTSNQASSTAISPTTIECGPLGQAVVTGSTNSTAIGCGTTITGAPDSVAMGRQNTVTATNSTLQGITERRGGETRLYPTGATNYAGTAVAIGNTNSVGAGGGVALGNSNQVTGGFHGIALGQGNVTSGAFGVGLGIGNLASGTSSVAIGTTNEATGNTAIALGRQTYSKADFGIAAGNIATVEAGATNGIALGTSANVAAAGINSVAVGANANASITNSVALGAGSTTTAPSGNSFLTNVAAVPANGVVSVGSATANRRIQNVAGGAADTDAVNVAQLKAQNTLTNKQGTDTAAALGGTSTYNPATGAVSAPAYSVGGTTVNNVGAAITNIDGRTTTNATNIAGNATNIAGLQNQTFRLRANTDTSTAVASGDTVTFLDGNNVNITRTGNNVTIGTSATPTFTTVTSTGAVNAGSLNTTGALTVAGTSNLNGGANLNNQKITNVASGTVNTDAANFGQVKAAKSQVAAGTNVTSVVTTTGTNGESIYTVNADKSTVSGGSTAVTVTPGTKNANNVTDYAVDLSAATKTSLGKADTAVQTITSSDANLTAVRTGNNVAFDFADAPTFAGQVKANGFDANNNKIVNVANGTVATDAATFGQLTTTNTKTDALGASTAANLGGGATYTPATGVVSAPAYKLNDGTVTATTVGGALTNLDGRTTTNATNIAGNATNITGLQNQTFKIQANNDTASAVKSSDTVKFVDGNNVNITRTGNNVTIGTSATPTFTTVTSTGAVNAGSLNTTGALTVTGVSNLNGGANLNNQKISNVANGNVDANSQEAINGRQLLSTAESVKTVIGGTAVNTAGIVTATNIGGTGAATIDGAITNVRDAATKAKTTVTEGKNVTVTTSENKDGSTNYNVKTNDDLALTSVTAGNSVLNNAGLTITGGPSVTTAGINAAGTKITGVTAGTAATDAATFGQLTTTNTKTDALGASTAANLGGGATYTPATGVVSAPAYKLNDGTVTATTVGGALTNLDGRTTTNATNIATNATNVAKGFNISAAGGTPDNVQLGETVNFTSNDKNLVVTNNGANGINYDLADNIVVNKVTAGDSTFNSAGVTITDGPNKTVTLSGDGLNNGGNRITKLANGIVADDAATFGQLTATNAAVTDAGNIAAGNIAALGGGAAYDAVNNTYTAPTYTLNNGANDANTTDFNTVGGALSNLDGRTTTNTADIAKGISFGDGITDNNFALGDTINVKGDNNLTSTTTADGVQVTLNKQVDLGTTGSITTGNTVTNNAGVKIDDAGRGNINTADYHYIYNSVGNYNISTVNSNTISNADGRSVTSATGTNVTDGTNTSNYGANGLTATDGTNTTILNKTGLSFTDANGATGPSITAAGINAGGQVLTNVGAGSITATSKDAINGSQLFGSAESVKNVIGGNAINTAGVVTSTDIGGTGANTIDGAITNVRDAATKAKTTVTEGKNVTVTTSTNTDGSTDYNVRTKDDLALTSVTTGNTVTNNAGVRIDNGTGNITAVTAAGTNVTDGTNTSNYGANGLTATDGTNTTIVNKTGLSFTDANGATGPSITAAGINAGGQVISGLKNGTIAAGSTEAITGDQLNTTNTNVTNNTTAIGDINAGRSGIVRQDAGTGAITVGAATGGTSVNFANSTGGARTLSGVADGSIAANSKDAINGGQINTLVNTVTGQINATNANVTDNTKRSTGNLAALGGGAKYDAATDTYTAPTYTLNNGDNDANTTDFNTVGGALSNLDGRTTTNTADIANVQAQANKGFNISAAGGTKNNVQLGETVDFTNTDGNLVATASANGINYNLAKNIDLDTTGSLKTGNTVTNNAGVRVANGTNTSNYGANGLVATDIFGNSSNYSAGSNIVSNGSSVNINTATASYINDSTGNLNYSTATNNVISKGTNSTTTSITGTNVTDGTNTSNYGANGLTATDGTNTTILNKTGLSFTDANGATGPSITAAGINAGGQVLTNVGAGSITATSKDAINGSQLFGSAESVKNVIGGNAVNTAGVVTSTDIGGTGANTIDGAITNVRDAATKAKTTVSEGKNVTVTTSTNTDGSTDYNVRTKDDLALTSVTTGNSVLNNTGLTITGGPSVTTAGINAAGNKVTNVANGTAAGDAVNFGQLTTAGTAVNNKINALGTSTAANLGGGAKYNTATGAVSAPTYTLDDGTNTGTNVTANNVGSALDNLNTRTTTNTGDIADLASGKTGIVRQDAGTGAITVGAATGGTSVNFANSTGDARQLNGVASAGDYTVAGNANNAVNAGDLNTAVNSVTDLGLSFAGDSGKNVQRKLGETLNVTGGANTATLTDNNIGVVTNDTNGLIVKLNKDIDLGADGSLKTGNTVTNNAGVTITDGNNITAVTAAGTNVTDGTNTSNYGANGSNIADKSGNTTVTSATGTNVTDGSGNEASYTARRVVLTDDAGRTNSSSAIGNAISDNQGNANLSGAIGNAVFDNQGNANLSGARGNVILDQAGNRTITSAAGNNVTDGTNTSNYGAEGLVATDAAGNSTIVNQGGLSFTDVNGTATGPSITAAGINAGNSTISNVADGVAASDVATFGQLTAANAAADTKTKALGTSTATNLGGTATYDEVTGTVSAPVYTLDDGTNKGTNVTANNVGGALDNLNTRTTTNTGDIANVQAQANKGFNISAAGGTANNVQLGGTVDFTNTDGNLVATASANGINYNLAENIDLGKDGSIRTGNTTVNNSGITILNGTVDTVTLGRNGLNNGGNRITNLAAGVVADDAATFGQVTDVNNKVNTLGTSTAANLGGGAKYNTATGAVSAPTYTLDDGTNTATTADFNNVGSALDNLNTRTTTNTGDIADLASGKTGLVRQDNGTGVITVGAATGGTSVNFANSTGVTRQLTGVASAGDYTVAGNANNAVNAGDLNTAVNSVTDLGLSFAGDSGKNVQRKLGETLNVTGGANTATLTDNNIGVVTNDTNGLIVKLNKDIDLGADGSLTTGNTVTNNAGVTITDGNNTSNYGANGFLIRNQQTNTISSLQEGNFVTFRVDENTGVSTGSAITPDFVYVGNGQGNGSIVTNDGFGFSDEISNGTVPNMLSTSPSIRRTGIDAGNTVITGVASAGDITDVNNANNAANAGDVNAAVTGLTNAGLQFSGDNTTAFTRKLGEELKIRGGATEADLTDNNIGIVSNDTDTLTVKLNKDIDLGVDGSLKTGNTVTNNAGVTITDGNNITAVTAAGTNVTDGTNTSNYGAEGLTIVGGPSITTAGINAGNQVITNVANGSIAANSTNATNGGQLFNTAESVKNVIGGTAVNTAGVVTATNIGGTGANTIDGAITNVRDAATKAKTTVTEGKNVTVTTSTNTDGSTDYNVRTKDDLALTSVTTGNTVTNNAGVRIDNGTGNITAVTAAGTNVTDGTNTSNYGAEGLTIVGGPSVTTAGINAAGNKITGVANGTAADDVATFGQLQASNGAATAKTDALGTSTAANLGGGATYTAATGTVSAPVYTLDDGTNKGTNVTANNVGGALDNLNTRTTTNTGDIANVQAQANKGFNISAAGGTANNVQLGETVDFTNTDGNLVATASANGINYNLAENIDLGTTGSLKTGNTVTNNAGIRIDNGTGNITAVTAAGTNVTDGTNTSNYGANGFTIVGGPSVTTAGINAGSKVITNLADGIAATDAATKGQVDAVSNGLTDLTAGAVQYERNNGNINYNNVTFAGTQAVIDQDEDGNDFVVSGGTRLSNVANGISAADAVNKGQLDGLIAQNITNVEVNDKNGNPITVNITDQVVNRGVDNNNMDSLFLTYNVEGQNVTDRLTIGETVQRMNTEGVKFAHTKAVSNESDIGITNDSSAGGDNSTAIGVNAIIREGANSTVALGHDTEASATATNSVVIGKNSQVAGQSSIAIGDGAQAMGNQSISIGTGNIVNGNNSGAFGDPSIINGDNSYSVGNNNTITTDNTFVLGNNVTSTVAGSVVLGTGSAARTGAGVVGYLAAGNAAITATTSTTGAVAVGDAANGIYRQVTGVAAGTADSDAVNVSQLKAVSDTLQNNNEALSNAAVQYDKNADGTVNKGSITLGGGAAGTTITNVAAGNISAGSTDAVNGSQLNDLRNGVANIIGGVATFDAAGNLTANNIGGTGKGNISDAIAAVNQGNVQANENIKANTDRLDAGLSFGADSGTTINKPVGDTTALKFEGGNNITTTTTSSGIKFDLNGNINVDNITAGTVTTGNTTVNNNGVTIKDGPSMTSEGINAGGKTITGVADGIKVNDAVNLGQLSALDNKLSNSVNELGYKINEVEDDANAGISAAMAMSSLPQAYIPGKSMVGGGIATYNGQSAVAIGVSKVSDNGRWVIKVNGTADTQGNAGGAVGAGFHF